MSEIGDREIAGFLDGDGCISISKVKKKRSVNWHYILTVIFAQSREDKAKILWDIKERYGGHTHLVKRTKVNENEKFVLRIEGAHALELITAVVPYLRVRKPQAELAVRFMNYYNIHVRRTCPLKVLPEHLEFYEKCKMEMHRYNRKGSATNGNAKSCGIIREIGDAEIAGFLDADGCISICRSKRRKNSSWYHVLHVVFAQSREDHADILRDIQARYGGFIVKPKRNVRDAVAFALRLSGEGAGKLLVAIKPYLRIKLYQAELALKFLEYRGTNRGGSFCKGWYFRTERLLPEHLEFYEECRQDMNKHNKRGL